MAKWVVEVFKTSAALHAAIEAKDNTIALEITPFLENGKQKFMLTTAS